MSMLQLRLLGAASMIDAGRAIDVSSQKAQALLFYLAAESGRSFSRSQLIALLWENSSEREGRNSLSTVLTRIRQAMPIFPLRIEGDTLAWQPASNIWVDLHDFAAPLPQPAVGGTDAGVQDAIRRLEGIAELYRGAFLEGFTLRDSESYTEWLRREHERWQQRWLNILAQLIEAYTTIKAWPQAIDCARRAVAASRLQERFHRALMRLHSFAGDRSAALAQFHSCREALARELGIEPDVETVKLYQDIVANRLTCIPYSAPRLHSPAARRPGALRFGARLTTAGQASFAGRADELALFAKALGEDEPDFAIVYVCGRSGIGKSALLNAFAQQCAAVDRPALLLDGRTIQPTPNDFLAALHDLTGTDQPLSALPNRSVILIDSYEQLAPLDSWLRNQLLPQLPYWTLVVLAARDQPSTDWRLDPGWQSITRIVQLGDLSIADVARYLQSRGISQAHTQQVAQLTGGYPLALALAGEALQQRPTIDLGDIQARQCVSSLLQYILSGAPSAAHQAALEASALAHVITEPLLAAMLNMNEVRELNMNEVRELFAWLCGLSFVTAGPRGAMLHDLTRDTLRDNLRRHNLPHYLALHGRAQRFYIAEFGRGSPEAQQAALLALSFLHENMIADQSAPERVLATDWRGFDRSQPASQSAPRQCASRRTAPGHKRSLMHTKAKAVGKPG
jgi:DNA-binding SARP family transcriptional activator